MTAPDRAAVIAAWRAVLDAIEPHESLPLPVFGSNQAIFHLYGEVAPGEMAALEAALPCEFTASASVDAAHPWFRLTGEIGGVRVIITAPAEAVAERKVTGQTVEDVVKWVRKPVDGTESEGTS